MIDEKTLDQMIQSIEDRFVFEIGKQVLCALVKGDDDVLIRSYEYQGEDRVTARLRALFPQIVEIRDFPYRQTLIALAK